MFSSKCFLVGIAGIFLANSILASPILTTPIPANGSPVSIKELTSTVTVYGCGSGATGADVDAGIHPPHPTKPIGQPSTSTVHVPRGTNLAPARHPDIDPRDLANLLTNSSVELFYNDPVPLTSNVSIAFMTVPNLAYPAVVLEHSDFIESIQCSEYSLSITFTHIEAFQTAKKDWVSAAAFVLIVNDPNCGNSSFAGIRDFVLVNAVIFSTSSLSMTASILHITVTQAIGSTNPVTVALGNYIAGSANGSTNIHISNQPGPKSNSPIIASHSSPGPLSSHATQKPLSSPHMTASQLPYKTRETSPLSFKSSKSGALPTSHLTASQQSSTTTTPKRPTSTSTSKALLSSTHGEESHKNFDSTKVKGPSSKSSKTEQASQPTAKPLSTTSTGANTSRLSTVSTKESQVQSTSTESTRVLSTSTAETSQVSITGTETTQVLSTRMETNTLSSTSVPATQVILTSTTTGLISSTTPKLSTDTSPRLFTTTETYFSSSTSVVEGQQSFTSTITSLLSSTTSIVSSQQPPASDTAEPLLSTTSTESENPLPTTSTETSQMQSTTTGAVIVPSISVDATQVSFSSTITVSISSTTSSIVNTDFPTTSTERIQGSSTSTAADILTSTSTQTTQAMLSSAVPVQTGSTGSSDFDILQDQKIGFLDVEDPTVWAQLFPGVIGEIELDFAGQGTGPVLNTSPVERRRSNHHQTLKRSLQKRGWWASVGEVFLDVNAAIAETAGKIAPGIINAIAGSVESTMADDIVAYDTLNPFSPKTYTPIEQDVVFATTQGSTQTPWGPATELLSKSANGGSVGIYCVGCGASGSLHIVGTITFSVAGGISSGGLNLNGPLNADLGLGFVASYMSSWTYQKEIANIPLSASTIPGILSVGPEISLTVGGALTVDADGQLLTGASLNWPEISAEINLTNFASSSVSGFTPDIQPVFAVEGSVSCTAEVHMLLSFGFSIVLLDDKIKKNFALVENPQLSITASTSGQTSSDGGAITGSIGDSDCAGDYISIGLTNHVYLDNFGIRQFALDTYNAPPFSTCFTIPQRRSVTMERTAADHSPFKRDTEVDLHTQSAPDVTYAVLNSLEGQVAMHFADNGNLYAATAGTSSNKGIDNSVIFTTIGENVVGDSAGRLFVAYSDTLRDIGVSRLRLVTAQDTPATAVMIALVPVDIGNDQYVVIASTTAAEFYYPIICLYDQLHPKIFLAVDPVVGAAVLADPAYLNRITGGNVTSCGFLPLIMSP